MPGGAGGERIKVGVQHPEGQQQVVLYHWLRLGSEPSLKNLQVGLRLVEIAKDKFGTEGWVKIVSAAHGLVLLGQGWKSGFGVRSTRAGRYPPPGRNSKFSVVRRSTPTAVRCVQRGA